MDNIDLVIFTCTGREHLLKQTYISFKENCDFPFRKVILAIDGQVDANIISYLQPDVIIQSFHRKGYVNNIINGLAVITSPLFFWLEDDWAFHQKIDVKGLATKLLQHQNWAEIILSKSGPLTSEQKIKPLDNNLYESIYGFSANPCLCNTSYLQSAFNLLQHAVKGDKLGEDGFENFLTKTFANENKLSVILDPVNGPQISHEGYLESTPRNFHMTNSIENITKEHLFIFPVPSFFRRLLMIVKLMLTFAMLAIKQLTNNKIYEYCFRVITGYETLKKD